MERRLRHLFTSIFCLGILWTLFVLWPGQAGHFVRRSSASAPALQEPDAASTATVSLVPTKTSHVSKRAASTWPQAVETGAGLMCKLKQKDRNGNYASDWTALSELQQYWTDTGYEGGGLCNDHRADDRRGTGGARAPIQAGRGRSCGVSRRAG